MLIDYCYGIIDESELVGKEINSRAWLIENNLVEQPFSDLLFLMKNCNS